MQISIVNEETRRTLRIAGVGWLEAITTMLGALAALGGLAGVWVSLFQTSSPPSSPSSPVPTSLPTKNSPASITQSQAVQLINAYLQAKKKIFAPPFDRKLAANLTTGELYEYITKPGGSIDSLQQRNHYYRYETRVSQPLGYFSATREQAQVDIKITQILFLYQNGIFKENQSYSGSYRFTLKQENGLWKISHQTKIGD